MGAVLMSDETLVAVPEKAFCIQIPIFPTLKKFGNVFL